MLARIKPSQLRGKIRIPGSKSHMIRALYLGSFAKGTSRIHNPVRSRDALSCLGVCRALGAEIDTTNDNAWTVKGGELSVPEHILDVGNSGTTLYLGTGLTASLGGYCVFTGDDQIRRRPIEPVLSALRALKAEAFSTRGNGSAPIIIRGPLKGGRTVIKGIISAYVSSIILGATLAEGDCEVIVDGVNEIPYIKMSVEWARRLGVVIKPDSDMGRFIIPGRQSYAPFEYAIPADFSSAAFLLVAAAITQSDVTLLGLDMNDVQGDKLIVHLLKDMGADIEITDDGLGGVRVRGGSPLEGRTIDCSTIPDSIPILSILGCCAGGETVLTNIESSRLKESDRPVLMCRELGKMGGRLELTDKELIIRPSALKGSRVESYADHRIAMAMCVGGLVAEGETLVNQVESAAVSFPGFDSCLLDVGARAEFMGSADGA